MIKYRPKVYKITGLNPDQVVSEKGSVTPTCIAFLDTGHLGDSSGRVVGL